jgi:DNA ligase-associated metallophosphoesterase
MPAKPRDADDLRDGKTAPLSLCGKSMVANMAGALWWPGQSTLVVADLHLEKGSSHAERGQMLPPYDTKATLTKLAALLDEYEPKTVIALGDSLHDKRAAHRLSDENLAILGMLQEDRSWVWVTGNHDPAIAPELGGDVCPEIAIDGIAFRHEPRAGHVTHEVAGHLHPAAKLAIHGHRVRRPCFVGNGRRLILPAFGVLTGGLNVLDEAYVPVFGNDGLAVWMLGHDGVFPVATRFLEAD